MYEHLTQIGTEIPSAEYLDKINEEGWELIQIVPHILGMQSQNVAPGQFAIYFRRPRIKQ